jgi:hypothetical protein
LQSVIEPHFPDDSTERGQRVIFASSYRRSRRFLSIRRFSRGCGAGAMRFRQEFSDQAVLIRARNV